MKRPRLTQRQIAAIRETPGTCRAIAQQIGCSKSAVAYHWAKMDAADDYPGADESDTEPGAAIIRFERVDPPRRCPRHGMMAVWPCVRCAAESAIYDR